MKQALLVVLGLVLFSLFLVGCEGSGPSAEKQQALQKEASNYLYASLNTLIPILQTKQLLKEASNQIGMPAIKNFQEKKIMKKRR